MGVDILFYKTKKHVFDKFNEDCNNDADINWDELEPHEINYACGRHFTFDFLVNHFSSQEIGVFNDNNIKNILSQANSVVNKWRKHNEEFYTIPVSLLEKYLTEAKKNGEEVVTFPLEEMAQDDMYIDDYDYYQAKDILETDWSKKEDEIIWFVNSY